MVMCGALARGHLICDVGPKLWLKKI